MKHYVGNDIVDLTDPRTQGRESDTRFLQRVFTSEEREVIASAPSPGTEVWCLWAAKEAAYKVVSKVLGTPPVFAHAAFAVQWHSREGDVLLGAVAYEGTNYPIRVERRTTAVHAVALSPRSQVLPVVAVEPLGDASLEELMRSLTPRESEAVHSRASAAVRVGARRTVAGLLDLPEDHVEIVCDPGVTGRRPPRVFVGGRPGPADVSLSHHGAFVAWAVLVQKPLGR